MAVSPVLITARRYQALLARYERASTARLVNSYIRSWSRLEAMLEALLLDIGDRTPTLGQLERMRRYRSLIGQITAELARLQGLTGDEIGAAGELIAIGEQSARELIGLTVAGRTQVATLFHTLHRSAIETMLGFLDPTGPLYDRLRLLTGFNADLVSDAIIRGITLGWNPRKIAAAVRNAFGHGLTDALRFVRTAQLWAYREANRASYIANRDVLEGWIWHANFDDRVCMSCVAQHGTIHPIEEPLNDHHNGRCVAIPLVTGFPNPVAETGAEWFGRQSEATQKKLMGRQFYEAWKAGMFDLSEMSTTRFDEVYGDMRVEARLWELLGTEPPRTKRVPLSQ